MDNPPLAHKFVKNKDMWSCMNEEQKNIIGNSNFWLNEEDVKIAINDTFDELVMIIWNGEKDFYWSDIRKLFKDKFGDAFLKKAEVEDE